MSVHWHALPQLCHNEAGTPESLALASNKPNEVGVSIILRYRLAGFLYFNCVPNLDLRWFMRGGLPIHRAGIVYVSSKCRVGGN